MSLDIQAARFTCPTCGSKVAVGDIKPILSRVKNGWHARDLQRHLAVFGSSEPLALANLHRTVGHYEQALARGRDDV